MAQATGSTAGKRAKRLFSSSSVETKRPNAKPSKTRSLSGKKTRKGLSPGFPLEDLLDEEFVDPEKAIAYLNRCLAGKDPGQFLLALQYVIRAQGGIGLLSKKTRLNREGLYDMLSKKGNPRLSSLQAILEALGLKLKLALNRSP